MKNTIVRFYLMLIALATFSVVACGQNATPTKAKKAPRNLAILIFDGVQIIDYTGHTKRLVTCTQTTVKHSTSTPFQKKQTQSQRRWA